MPNNQQVKSVGELLDTIPYDAEGTGLSSRSTTAPTSPVKGQEKKPTKQKSPLPTLSNAQKKQQELQKKTGNFSEDTLPANVFKKISPVKQKLSNLKDETPAKRAEIGMKFGGGVGLGVAGPHGAIIGGAIGAHAARSLGALQSGEHEGNLRRGKIVEVFQEFKIADKNGKVKFADGGEVTVKNDPAIRLRNVSPIMSGEKDRSFHKVDKSHPMANRTATVARPIARYIAQAVLGYSNDEDPQDAQAIDTTTGIVINMLQEKAKSIDHVYVRAREVVKKLKCNEEHMRGFFNAQKTKISEKEAGDIKKGLDILYA